jgi:hypothetical protein
LVFFFPGYRVTPFGSIVGFAYAFVSGGLVAYVVARVYNWVAHLRSPRPVPSSSLRQS